MTAINTPFSGFSATYSPDDNKLRLYSLSRLDSDTYAQAKELGFKWAPKQGFFVAPAWTPAREDFLLGLCEEIGDEDKSLTERAEERAERFDEYSERRAADAHTARSAVSALADHIPFGQPILVGHHSERRARKDAERIENGMRRAISLWETSAYWQHRAAGALAHARYKERADVRYRRIKNIETDRRKVARQIEQAEQFTSQWNSENLTQERAQAIANYDHVSKCFTLAEFPRAPEASQYEGLMSLYSALEDGIINAEQAREIAVRVHAREIARAARWRDHYDNRLTYERAMLGESGGIAAEKFSIEVGGMVLIRSEWVTVVRITKKDGAIASLTTNRRSVRKIGIEEIKDYRAPTAEDVARVKKAIKLHPLVNYPGEGFIELTAEQYKRKCKDYKGTRVEPANAEHGAYRYRTAILPNGGYRTAQVFITDAKRVDPPAAGEDETAASPLPRIPVIEPAKPKLEPVVENAEFSALKNQLKVGVQVVAAPQLFVTPRSLAALMIDHAEMPSTFTPRVLEPSAGTGRLLEALPGVSPFPGSRQTWCDVVAIEISAPLSQQLEARGLAQIVINGDFLELSADDLGDFDRVVMNPPFQNATDIEHIQKAASLLRAGGVLVAICANGPRQQKTLKPWAEGSGGYWEVLPPDTFGESGTNVNTALLVFRA